MTATPKKSMGTKGNAMFDVYVAVLWNTTWGETRAEYVKIEMGKQRDAERIDDDDGDGVSDSKADASQG